MHLSYQYFISCGILYQIFLVVYGQRLCSKTSQPLTPTWSRSCVLLLSEGLVWKSHRLCRSDLPLAQGYRPANIREQWALAVSFALPDAESWGRRTWVTPSRCLVAQLQHSPSERKFCSSHFASVIPQKETMWPQDEQSALYRARVAADAITACNTGLHRRTSRALSLPAIRNASRLLRTTTLPNPRKARPRSRPEADQNFLERSRPARGAVPAIAARRTRSHGGKKKGGKLHPERGEQHPLLQRRAAPERFLPSVVWPTARCKHLNGISMPSALVLQTQHMGEAWVLLLHLSKRKKKNKTTPLQEWLFLT